MITISAPNRSMASQTSNRGSAPTRDVTASIKSWGRRGIYCGALFGFALGAVFVAIPLSTDILTFGVFGTLLVAAVECSVLAGGFAALAAALFCDSSSTRSKPTLSTERRTADDDGREADAFPAAWTDLWSYPARTTSASPDSDENLSAASTLQNIQTRLNTIDAWENGNTGP